MCLAIPMKVLKIKGDKGIAECEGLRREVDVRFLKSVKKGDFIIIHAGFAIERLDRKRAEETLELFREMKT